MKIILSLPLLNVTIVPGLESQADHRSKQNWLCLSHSSNVSWRVSTEARVKSWWDSWWLWNFHICFFSSVIPRVPLRTLFLCASALSNNNRVNMNPLWIHFLTSWESHYSRAAGSLSSAICMRRILFVFLNQEWLDAAHVRSEVRADAGGAPCLLWFLLCMEECCLLSVGLKSRKVPYRMVEH